MGTGIAGADGGPVVVSIIDDHPDLCYGVLDRLPRANSSLAAGIMAASLAEFLALEAEAPRRSDVVLLDLKLKDGSVPADNIARLKNDGYPVVIYTGEERPERLLGTLGIGADLTGTWSMSSVRGAVICGACLALIAGCGFCIKTAISRLLPRV